MEANMAIQAIDLTETQDYISKYDIGEDGQKTTWKLGALDTRIKKTIEDIAWEYEANPNAPGDAKAKASFNMGKTELQFVQFGLKGFDNFMGKGRQIYFETEVKNVNGKAYHVLKSEILGIIPGDVLKELAEKIKEINNVSEEERKN